MVTEDYVSFETSRLLKEKGFESDECVAIYDLGDNNAFIRDGGIFDNGPEDYLEYQWGEEWRRFGYYLAPTLQMALKWLREKHNLHCVVDYDFVLGWYCQITSLKETVEYDYEEMKHYHPEKDNGFSSPEEACEAAIRYCLNNLIKNEDEEEESDIPVPKTVDEAISTLEKILSDEDREYLLKNGAISMHESLGRWIRNEWGLWTGSELKNELKKKGFEHPDDMSNYIIEEFIKYWNNKI